jgi:hypothetical protein
MTWERVDVKGNVPPPSTRHQIMNVNDKQMLMIGGQDEARRSHKEIYFLNTGKKSHQLALRQYLINI